LMHSRNIPTICYRENETLMRNYELCWSDIPLPLCDIEIGVCIHNC